ncbi:MAG: MerR family transcriptional regulator [Gammaproteobacteria bacterium]|nr:MerR family transcriptional regulator [Gammaproteobacteria bacterium]MDH5177843.1 MerR family transcriptional regulator [Gammaproteobacteria bacterium]
MSQPTPDTHYTLDQLAELAGVNPRTVRYYIQLGLVDAPVGQTRAAHYTWQHLRQLLEVRGYTEQGFSLERIGALMRGDDSPPPAAHVARPGSVTVHSHINLAEGVELVIEPGRAGLTPEQLRRFAREAIAAFARISKDQE